MKQQEIIIENPTGLHARPAKVFVGLAKQYKSDIRVQHGEKIANAKSLISMLTLGAEKGAKISLSVTGEDEDTALAELVSAIRSGLGEGPHIETQSTKEAPAPAPVVEPPPQQIAAIPPIELGKVLRGLPGAPGIAIGPLFQLQRAEIVITEGPAGTPLEEENRLRTAIEKARLQIDQLRKKLLAKDAGSEADIFDVHLELLEDAELLDAVLAKIRERSSAAQAWQSTIEARARIIAALKDPLLAARSADLHDVGYRVLRILMGADEQGYALPDQPVVVIARDLSPSDTASLPREKVLGFCTAAGGPTSHTAIIARALSLPAVVSAGAEVLNLANQTLVILNGNSGTLAVDPPIEAVQSAHQAQQTWQQQRSEARLRAAESAVTQDGQRVEVVANIGGLKDAQEATQMGAEGVGLLRTEFLFLDRSEAPTEQEQYEVYRDITVALQGQPVIVRTLDIGGDKPLSYVEVPPEENPFLGERGIRLCLARPALFRQQLRAILRAAAHGPLRIMFPMVADLSELRAARGLIEELRSELSAPKVDLGIMVEIPSAAVMADVLAWEVDFFSIGTNDLTQYTLAMDRMHPSLASKSDGLHPAVLRLISATVVGAHKAGKWVGVCGELGADPQAVPILVGLGVDELSVSVPSIPTVKAQIRSLKLPAAQALAQKALACATADQVRALSL